MIEKLKELQQMGQVILSSNREGHWVCRATFVVKRRNGTLLTCRAESILAHDVEEAVSDCHRIAMRDFEEGLNNGTH